MVANGILQIFTQFKVVDEFINDLDLGNNVFFYQVIKKHKTGYNSCRKGNRNIVPTMPKIKVNHRNGDGYR
jgi:hypothetical protein